MEYNDSKSFLAVLSLMVRCILYPGAKLCTAAGGKGQSASILKEKVDEICRLVPAFEREIDRRPGRGTTETKDKCVYRFKNGSYFDNVAANEKTRGGRRHARIIIKKMTSLQTGCRHCIISIDRVSGIVNKKYYLNLINNYYFSQS